MIKKILPILTMILIATNCTQVLAYNDKHPHKPTFKEQRQMDNLLNERLNLTKQQQEQLRENRTKHKKEMQEIVEKMQIQHDKIRDIYYSGIPKFQADLKTAPLKAELVLLKQNADKLRQEHRKNFKNILTEEQKIEFEKLKKEIHDTKKVAN